MVNIESLNNGLKIVYEKIPYVRTVAFGIWVNNGTRNEDKEINGVSHFIEHMMFKGTSKRSAKDIATEMDNLGGQFNAYTTKEYTCYHTRVLDTHFEKSLEVMSDMFLNSKFDESDIVRERGVINEEISMYDDAPEELVHDALQEEIWKKSSLGMPILGTYNSISNINEKNLKAYFKRNYNPKNTVLSVVGNVDENLIPLLEKYFGSWHVEEEFSQNDTKTIYTPSVIEREKDIDQVHLIFAFEGISRTSDEKFTQSVFNSYFGGGMSSVLFQKIREEHSLTYSIYSYTSSYLDTGIFAIYATMSKNQVEKVVKLILDEIENCKINGIDKDILENVKEQSLISYLMGMESTVNKMNSYGTSMLLRNCIIPDNEIEDKIKNVTCTDVKNFIDKVFDYNKMSISFVGNINGINIKELVDKHISNFAKF